MRVELLPHHRICENLLDTGLRIIKISLYSDDTGVIPCLGDHLPFLNG